LEVRGILAEADVALCSQEGLQVEYVTVYQCIMGPTGPVDAD